MIGHVGDTASGGKRGESAGSIFVSNSKEFVNLKEFCGLPTFVQKMVAISFEFHIPGEIRTNCFGAYTFGRG